MYKQLFLTLFLLIFCTPSWSETLTMDDLVKRKDLYYKKFTDVPFTGKIHGFKSGGFKKGKKNGEWVSYHKNGQLQYKINYKDGKPEDGPTEWYYENGQVWGKFNYKDGKLNGLLERFHENGQLQRKENRKDGKLDGLYESYWWNGQLSKKGIYKDGKPDGLWVYFYDDGSLIKTETYINGVIQK